MHCSLDSLVGQRIPLHGNELGVYNHAFIRCLSEWTTNRVTLSCCCSMLAVLPLGHGATVQTVTGFMGPSHLVPALQPAPHSLGVAHERPAPAFAEAAALGVARLGPVLDATLAAAAPMDAEQQQAQPLVGVHDEGR